MDNELLKRLLGFYNRPQSEGIPPSGLKRRSLLDLGTPARPQVASLLAARIESPPPIKRIRPPLTLKVSQLRVGAAIRKAIAGDIKHGLVLPDPDTLGITDGRQLQAAILYADLRGFSSMVAESPKRAALVVLEAFFSEMTRIASALGGEVLDCAGDRILAAFSSPLGVRSAKPVHNAVTCALWMQTVMAKVVIPELEIRGYYGLSCGIGLDYGNVVIARVGIRNRNKLVFLGNPANFAAKLEELAEPGETVLSALVYNNRPAYLSEADGWVFVPGPRGQIPLWYKCKNIFADDSPPR